MFRGICFSPLLSLFFLCVPFLQSLFFSSQTVCVLSLSYPVRCHGITLSMMYRRNISVSQLCEHSLVFTSVSPVRRIFTVTGCAECQRVEVLPSCGEHSVQYPRTYRALVEISEAMRPYTCSSPCAFRRNVMGKKKSAALQTHPLEKTFFRFYNKLKNVSCEYDRLNG